MESSYFALFFSAFISSTLIPASSEAVLGYLSATSGSSIGLLIAIATLGNTLGAVVNWLLGRYCLRWRDRKWFPVKPNSLKRATLWFQRYGAWSILLAWAPIIGDPLTFIAGALRMNFWLFVLLAGLGKAARYAVVAGVVLATM
jgi:membrane protein YqaA with SNARE-associated domain